MKTTILFWAAAVSIPSVLVSYIEPARYSFVPLTEQRPMQTAVFALERSAAAPYGNALPDGSAAPLQAIAESRPGVGRCTVNRACE
jgi:hypothetical protein